MNTDNNIFNITDHVNILDDDGYESNDEISVEITDYKNGNHYTHVYTVPYRPTHCNEKRLICFSTINREPCSYGMNCTYAHSPLEQIIDEDKKFIYQIVLDSKLMNFFSMTNPKTDEIYKHLLFMTHLCDSCANNKCTGGFNCRNGVSDICLKLCKNDLLTGECLNKETEIAVDREIVNKMKNGTFEPCDKYYGCINGHHLTKRNLVPYYKFVHQKESSKKNKYQSVRYIDINPLPLDRIFPDNSSCRMQQNINFSEDSDSSTDEEINGWFQKKDDDFSSDSDSD